MGSELGSCGKVGAIGAELLLVELPAELAVWAWELRLKEPKRLVEIVKRDKTLVIFLENCKDIVWELKKLENSEIKEEVKNFSLE